jgi:hypothetical protein
MPQLADRCRRWRNLPVVNGLRRQACPVCAAEPGDWCDWQHEAPVELLQLGADAYVHTPRAQLAVNAGEVKLREILKRVPDWSAQPDLHAAG